MSSFKPTTLADSALDPRKRVHYSTGLVLGVDEFQQEQLYFLEKDRLHQRALHGYGTVCGLAVEVKATDGGPEVVVEPGLALNPRGDVIRVCQAQCARLDEWLAGNPDQATPASPPVPFTLYVVLCHLECETDDLPVPGGPCLKDSTEPTRITETFELAFRLEHELPRQEEETAVRRFGELLRSIDITDDPEGTVTTAELIDEVRSLVPASPPMEDPVSRPLRIHSHAAETSLEAALQVWVTEVRPQLLPPDEHCACGTPGETCVLLARLQFDVVQTGEVRHAQGVEIDETDRPFLLSTRLLRELAQFGGPRSTDETPALALDDLSDVEVADSPVAGVLHWNPDRERWNAEQLALDDLKDVQGDDPPAGGLLRWNADAGHWQAARLTLEHLGNVEAATPPDGALLCWNQATYQWEAIPAPEPEPVLETDLVRIVALSWQHGKSHDFRLQLDDKEAFGLVVAFGFERPGDGGMARIGPGSLDANSFQVYCEQSEERLTSSQRIKPLSVTPVQPTFDSSGQGILQATRIDEAVAPAAAFLIDQKTIGTVRKADRVLVRILGDFVLDHGDPARALDLGFVRGQLPTGQRPGGRPVGLQGGTFESWIPRQHRVVLGGLDINRASKKALLTLPGIGPAIAQDISKHRETKPFRTVDDLRNVAKVNDSLVEQLRRLG